jgi:hypothetical protein
VPAQPVEPLRQARPQVIGDRDLLVVEVHRVHDLAVDVELPLPDGAVTDPDRLGAVIALQVTERHLGDVVAAVDRVHDHHIAFRGGLLAPLLQPVHEARRLLEETEPHQAVHRERGIAQPGVAVVPVPRAAGFLRQRGGRGGDQGARGVIDEKLEREGGALHHLTPAARVP